MHSHPFTMIQELQGAGLERKEAEVYLTLSKTPSMRASEIAQQTSINRSVVYSVLAGLIDKGLVTETLERGIKQFSTTNPRTLLDMLKKKEAALNKIIPDLESLKDESEEIVVEVYRGKTGLISVLKDILRTEEDYVSIGEDGSFEREAPLTLQQYVRDLNEKGIKEKILAKPGTKTLIGKRTEMRYLPKEFDIPTITTIYGGKVAIAIVKQPYHCVLIRSPILARTYEHFFNTLWSVSRKT